MAEHQIQRNRRTGEYRHLTERGWEPYTPMPEGTPERYLPGLADTPTSAVLGELGRTGKEAAMGLARSPLDALKGLFQLTTSPVESVKGVVGAVADPRVTVQALADNPREAGSLLGQVLLGKIGLPRVPAAAARIPSAVSATGRGLEAAGKATMPLSKYATVGALAGGQPGALALAATPYALKYGGKGLQQAGQGLERVKRLRMRPEATTPEVQLELPSSWRPFTENPVTQSLRAILEELRTRPTAGLTNPLGR